MRDGAKQSIRCHLDIMPDGTVDVSVEQAIGGAWFPVESGSVHGTIPEGAEAIVRILWEMNENGYGE
jgi:hypothetical protein